MVPLAVGEIVVALWPIFRGLAALPAPLAKLKWTFARPRQEDRP